MYDNIKNYQTQWRSPLGYAEDATFRFAKATTAWEGVCHGRDEFLMRAAFQKLLESAARHMDATFITLAGVIEQYYGVSESEPPFSTGIDGCYTKAEVKHALPLLVFKDLEGAVQLDGLQTLVDTALLVDFDRVRFMYDKAAKAAAYMESNLVLKVCDFICALEDIKPQGTMKITDGQGKVYEFLRY